MNSRPNQIITQICALLKEQLHPARIILFGSRAKGKNGRHADFDFAIDGPAPSLTLERTLKEKADKISGLYKVELVYLDTVDEGFKKIVLNTGKVLYERRN